MDNCTVHENDRVRIPSKKATGTVLDIFERLDGVVMCTIESDDPALADDPDGWVFNNVSLYTCEVGKVVKI